VICEKKSPLASLKIWSVTLKILNLIRSMDKEHGLNTINSMGQKEGLIVATKYRDYRQ